jgi:hypothetical protein
MRLVGLAVVGLALIGAQPALAQYYVPRPVVPIGPPAIEDVSDIIQAMGLDPMGQPMRSGPFYVQRATDDFGRVLRVTVDARRSQVVAIEPAGAPGYRAPYAAHGGPYGRRSYPMYGALPDDDDIAPTGSIMAPPGQAPRAVAPPAVPQQPKASRPAAKSAAVTPNPPVPRKRPAAAPQEAVGSVEPMAPAQATAPQAAPQNSAPQAATAPALAKPESAMPPVAPLE